MAIRSRTVSAFAFALLLGACSQPSNPERFFKAGATTDDYTRDSYECERETRSVAASFGTGPAAQANARDFMFKCMSARGYSYGHFR